MRLDRTNLLVLERLQRDARTTVSELARSVGCPESTLRDRLASLERYGVIHGYRALVSPSKLGYRLRAIVRASCDMGNVSDIARQLASIPNVVRADITTGSKPLCIEVLAEDLVQLEQLVESRISKLGLREIELGLVVQSLLEQRPVPTPSTGTPRVVAVEPSPVPAPPSK